MEQTFQMGYKKGDKILYVSRIKRQGEEEFVDNYKGS
jgi:hypothetical protein